MGCVVTGVSQGYWLISLCFKFKKYQSPRIMENSSTLHCCSGMMLKLGGTNLVWMPRNLAQDVSLLDHTFQQGLIRVSLQSFEAFMGPIFRSLR